MVREKGESSGNLYLRPHATTKRTSPEHEDRLDLARKEGKSEVKWHAIIGRIDGARLEEGLQLPPGKLRPGVDGTDTYPKYRRLGQQLGPLDAP